MCRRNFADRVFEKFQNRARTRKVVKRTAEFPPDHAPQVPELGRDGRHSRLTTGASVLTLHLA
jgi:hypothetical protein